MTKCRYRHTSHITIKITTNILILHQGEGSENHKKKIKYYVSQMKIEHAKQASIN